jgi:hypothetical protein
LVVPVTFQIWAKVRLVANLGGTGAGMLFNDWHFHS